MTLTGRCKEEFLKNVYFTEDCTQVNENLLNEILEESECWLSNQDERFVYALIIEWFDTQKILIQHWCSDGSIGDEFDCEISFNGKLIQVSNGFHKSRHEAIEQAIIKANEIYNELNK